ncbi:MAG: hypothetical protein AAF203_01350, partial [Pseudomonadota bacterium]
MKILILLFISFIFAGSDPNYPYQETQIYDPFIGHLGRPHGVGYSSTTGERIEYKINQYGFREKDIDFSETETKILAFGASETYGLGLPADHRWSNILEKKICGGRVMNLSMAGYSVDQVFLSLKKWLLYFGKPDIVFVEIPVFNEDYLQLSQVSWAPDSTKPYLKEKGNGYEVVPASAPIPWMIPYSEERHPLLKNLIAGYNSIVRDYILFPKSKKKSDKVVTYIFKSIEALAEKYKIPFVVYSRDLAMPEFEGLSSDNMEMIYMGREIPFKKYKISDLLGHINLGGNQKMADLFLDQVVKKVKNVKVCRN